MAKKAEKKDKEGKKKKPKKSLEKILDDSEAVLFDMDMTLLDWTDAAAAAYSKILKKRGKKEIDAAYVKKHLVQLRFKEQFEHLGIEDIDQAMNEYDYAVSQNIGRIRVYEGVVEMIYALKENGKKIGIVTNNYNRPGKGFLEKVVQSYNKKYGRNESSHSLFDYVGFADDYNNESKPSPIPIERAMDYLNASPSSTTIIGDSSDDSIGGRRAGTYTVGLMNVYSSDKQFVEKPDAIVSSTGEFSKKVTGHYGLEHKLAA